MPWSGEGIIGKLKEGPAAITPYAHASYAQYCDDLGQTGTEPMSFDQWTRAGISTKLEEVALSARRDDAGGPLSRSPRSQ